MNFGIFFSLYSSGLIVFKEALPWKLPVVVFSWHYWSVWEANVFLPQWIVSSFSCY